jgi:hypothetical protein
VAAAVAEAGGKEDGKRNVVEKKEDEGDIYEPLESFDRLKKPEGVTGE